MSHSLPEFEALGKKVAGSRRNLETFPRPESVTAVHMTSDEVTSVCPITGQPDFYTIEIAYQPRKLCIESKSLKLYLQSFREEGVFCEQLAHDILRDVVDALDPAECTITVHQKARGGIAITATAQLHAGGQSSSIRNDV